MKYLSKFSLDPSDNPNAIQNVSNNRYLPNRSLVLSGSEIFNFFFDGTTGDSLDEQGTVTKKNLSTDWKFIQGCFDNALVDISEMSHDNTKTYLEYWFDVLKKVMRMWTAGSELASISK